MEGRVTLKETTIESCVSNLEEQIKRFESEDPHSVSEKSYIEWNLWKLSLYLAKLLLNDEAMLLPQLFILFQQHTIDNVHKLSNVTKGKKKSIPTQRWFLSSISNLLGDHLGVICKTKKYGTLLFRKNGDILKALSNALGKAQKDCTAVELGSLGKTGKKNRFSDSCIVESCYALNERINMQIKALIQAYQGNFSACSDFNADSFIQQLDPLLYQCIQVLTTPTRDRRRFFSCELQFQPGNKTIKQLYCLSTIFYVTNHKCSMPLQYLLADALLCLGGSTELLKIFNRIGAVASLDTHDRVATSAVIKRITDGIGPELEVKSFTAVSIDNIDILQRHAMVSSADTKRSWHGTSIQATQPLPKSIVVEPHECITTVSQSATPTNTSGKRYSLSPIKSPMPTQVHKRQRTLLEGSSSHTKTLVTSGHELAPEYFQVSMKPQFIKGQLLHSLLFATFRFFQRSKIC